MCIRDRAPGVAAGRTAGSAGAAVTGVGALVAAIILAAVLDGRVTRYETACGLTPAARGALGVGEVKAEKSSPLDAILQQAATRRQA